MFKKICGMIFDRILPAVFVVLGTPALFYGIWFQTEGFTLYENFGVAPMDVCLGICALGIVVGLFIMNYFKKQTTIRVKGKGTVHIKDLKNMIRGYLVCGFLCWGILWMAFTTMYFYLGIAGMALCVTSVAYYLVWLYQTEKKEKAEKEEEKA